MVKVSDILVMSTKTDCLAVIYHQIQTVNL